MFSSGANSQEITFKNNGFWYDFSKVFLVNIMGFDCFLRGWAFETVIQHFADKNVTSFWELNLAEFVRSGLPQSCLSTTQLLSARSVSKKHALVLVVRSQEVAEDPPLEGAEHKPLGVTSACCGRAKYEQQFFGDCP